MATVHCPGETKFTFITPHPDCSNNKKVFEKCDKVLPTSFCITLSAIKQCNKDKKIDCMVRELEFQECLKNGCPPDMCDKRTEYLTLCVEKKPDNQ